MASMDLSIGRIQNEPANAHRIDHIKIKFDACVKF